MGNKYIELEEVLKLLDEYPSSNTNKIIQGLPEPIDIESIIDEIKREVNEEDKDIDSLDDMDMGKHIGKSIILKRIKSRLLK